LERIQLLKKEQPTTAPQSALQTPEPLPANSPQILVAAAEGLGDSPVKLEIGFSTSVPGDTLVILRGVPRTARLSTGIDVGQGQWLLPPSRVKDLTISVPSGIAGKHQLEAQLLKDDAQTPISPPTAFALTIHGTPQTTQGKTNPIPDEAPHPETDFLTQMLIRDGNKKMREGDILAARRFYEQAAAKGNAEGALAMGRSYDPTYFEKLAVKTGKPDPATAFDWYKKALDGGLPIAKVKIDQLKQWLQR
jgi:hypothetical protein